MLLTNQYLDKLAVAAATFISPSDPCGVGHAHHEQIKATLSWFHGTEYYDTVFVNTDDTHRHAGDGSCMDCLLFLTTMH